MRLVLSLAFGGIVYVKQSQWNTMKGGDFRCPRGGVQRTAGTVDSDDDVTMTGGDAALVRSP
ncbi:MULTISPECIES: hypothetical protein [unclassified Rhodococcus (in: high G+C Gram-positive bacteria)]|uniref:hypothetical protein n=1 Tax=unclassified Rhodococcus (in: high G+C Gram-positive bacteria) TaxID=192944 RepID=UPI001ED91C65|nr:hypothetical protein [Rhodococcus sp. DK17]